MKPHELKLEVQKQWNRTPCGSTDVPNKTDTLDYFDAISKNRYERTDPWLKNVIPFSTGCGKRVLEIGFGMGTDLLSWRKAGAEVYGIDITQEHYRLAKRNFELHGEIANLQLADAADIPFPANFFDIVYTCGVLHHTPDTVRCISEAFRVLRPGGQLIFAVYHTYSAFHIFYKVLWEGLYYGKLKKLGYKGLMATIEKGADGITIKPLVKTYRKRQLKYMLEDFSKVEFDIAHFKRHHIPKVEKLIPRFAEKFLEKWLGWYLIAYATK